MKGLKVPVRFRKMLILGAPFSHACSNMAHDENLHESKVRVIA